MRTWHAVKLFWCKTNWQRALHELDTHSSILTCWKNFSMLAWVSSSFGQNSTLFVQRSLGKLIFFWWLGSIWPRSPFGSWAALTHTSMTFTLRLFLLLTSSSQGCLEDSSARSDWRCTGSNQIWQPSSFLYLAKKISMQSTKCFFELPLNIPTLTDTFWIAFEHTDLDKYVVMRKPLLGESPVLTNSILSLPSQWLPSRVQGWRCPCPTLWWTLGAQPGLLHWKNQIRCQNCPGKRLLCPTSHQAQKKP